MNTLGSTGPASTPSSTELAHSYEQVRAVSLDLCRTLVPEDMMVQSMPDASPTKWHLAHVTWFFEYFLLLPHLHDYQPFNPEFNLLFNSYYRTVGAAYPRADRGLLSRPTMPEILDYRAHVDAHMARLFEQCHADDKINSLARLGLNHEQQHQELLLTDIKHALALNPLKPIWRELPIAALAPPSALNYVSRPNGLTSIGHTGKGFAFDNELPRHQCFLNGHAIASRPVTNSEYLEFIRDRGYDTPELWLSDGFALRQREGWERPLYWNEDMTAEFTLGGMRPLDLHAPVCHISYYEADAMARWMDARLPTEVEWEALAAEHPVAGNFMERGLFHPTAARAEHTPSWQLFGDVWQWTSSAYAAYPGYRPLEGSLGEYNGKFMCNQLVLRGGSCVTPRSHMRASYRNFWYPQQRWQFMGMRLAKDE